MCDFIIASEKASFGFPEIKLGLLPGGGGTQRILNRISSAHARELIMFGDTLDAEKALNWGLVNAVFSNPECFEKTLAFAEKLNQQSPDSLKAIKHLLSLSSSTPLEQRLITEREAFYDRLNSTDAQTRINAFFNRNK
jgi:enoyl-CoA hydratase/carnithine racemase